MIFAKDVEAYFCINLQGLMKKNTLLNSPAVHQLITMIEKLKPETPGLWGTMDATEMLLHCTLADQFILEDKSPYQRRTLKQWLITKLCMYLLPKFPKNRKGPLRLQVKGKTNESEFEAKRKDFINTLLRFPSHNQPFTSVHPGMGYLTTEEWGTVAWMHMDHHLRQFGV